MIDIFSSKPGFDILVSKCGTYFTLHDVHHLLTDGSDLGGLSVGGLLDLVLSSLGETNAKESELVSVSGCTIIVIYLHPHFPPNQNLPYDVMNTLRFDHYVIVMSS